MNDELPKVDPLWEQSSTQPEVGHAPPAQHITQPSMFEMGQAPSPNPITPPPTQIIQGQMQPMMTGITTVPQQVIYIPLTYKPTTNYRTISYIVLSFGVIIAIFGNILAEVSGSYILMDLSSLVCCGSFTAVLFLDAAYYKGKADWQMANGMPNTGSTASLVIESIFGIICAIFFVLMLIGALFPV